jgi:hypothetical protein
MMCRFCLFLFSELMKNMCEERSKRRRNYIMCLHGNGINYTFNVLILRWCRKSLDLTVQGQGCINNITKGEILRKGKVSLCKDCVVKCIKSLHQLLLNS